MRRPQGRTWMLPALLVVLIAAGCGRSQSKTAVPKIIVLGMDAMDPVFLERHWDALPNLDRLRHSGEFRRLGTSIPPQSPVAWSTFITGMDPGGHGIFDFIHRNPKTLMPFSSMAETEEPKRTLTIGPYVIPLSQGKVKTFRQGKAFWQMLDEQGIPVTVIRIPNNFPPVECNGRTLSGMGVPDMRGTFGTFSYYSDDPNERERNVSGGRILKIRTEGHHAILNVEGPVNTLRKDRPMSSVAVEVDRDPAAPAAQFSVGDERIVLREGEWSNWIRAEFPLIPGLTSASGMFRIYAKQIHPHLGIYVSPVNLDPEKPDLPISTPKGYSAELARAIGPFYTQGMAEDTAAFRQGVLTREEYRRQSHMVSREHLSLLDYEVQRFTGGLLFFHFFGIDQDSHVFWGTHEKELLETYKLADEAVGRVMKKAGDATLIVMSDHGFSNFNRAVHLNTWLWREGFLELDDPENASDEELFVHVDWQRTMAYSIGLNSVYLNLEGRERNGIVTKGEESASILQRLKERLEGFRDPDNGRTVVERVYLTSDVYHGAAAESAPDVIVGWAPGYRSSWQTALGAVPKVLIEDNKDEWAGDHCIAAESVPGSFLCNRKTRLADPRLQDVTVTLLAEFGLPKGKGMSGRPMF